MEEAIRDEAYRIYVTKSLQLIPQNKYISIDYTDAVKPHKADMRNGDEIVMETMKKAGLHFEG